MPGQMPRGEAKGSKETKKVQDRILRDYAECSFEVDIGGDILNPAALGFVLTAGE